MVPWYQISLQPATASEDSPMPETSQAMTDRSTNNVKGVLWALLATGLFATMTAMAKVAVTEYHVLQILFFRQIVVFASALPSIAAASPGSLRTRYPGLHAIRLVGAFVALS